MRTFGENLRELRKSRGYSQEKFAEVIGTKQVNVSAWEVGTRVPYLSTIRGIADTFKVPLSSLISLEQTGMDEDYAGFVMEAISREPKLNEETRAEYAMSDKFHQLSEVAPSRMDRVQYLVDAYNKVSSQ